MNTFSRVLASAALAVAVSIGTVAVAAEISGAGATFPFPIYAKWAAAYKAQTGIGLNYQSIGSGGGISQIEARTVTFGATDMPMTAADLEKNGLVMFPTVIGAEVLVYNLPGIATEHARSRRSDARQHLSRQNHDTGTIRRSRSSIPPRICPIRPSPSSTAPTAPAPPLFSPIICPR